MSRIEGWRTTGLSVVLAGIGVLAPLLATRGFTAVTTDAARALDVATHPRPVPQVALLDADSVPRLLNEDGRALIVDFVATRCQTLCATQNGVYQQLQREIAARGLTTQVRLVTISFDPTFDTPRALRYFALAQRVDPARWTLLTPRDSASLQALLAHFGITVIREGTELIHNTALHVVSPDGRLVAITPITAADDALALATSFASRVP